MDKDRVIQLLEARVSTLESQVDFLLRINGLDISALRSAPDEQLLRHYQEAVQLLGLGPKQLDPEVIQRWAELFVQISEYELARLQGIVDYDHTWEPVYQLCIRMMTVIRQHRQLPTDVGLQHLYALLEKGRRGLRDSAVLMIKRNPESLPARAKLLLRSDDLAQVLQK